MQGEITFDIAFNCEVWALDKDHVQKVTIGRVQRVLKHESRIIGFYFLCYIFKRYNFALAGYSSIEDKSSKSMI